MLQKVAMRPRTSLGRIVDDLGATMLDLLCGNAEQATDIDGVVIHDPLDEPLSTQRTVVLGIGVGAADDIVALLLQLGRDDAAALVVRAPVEVTLAVRDAAERSGVALLALARGASWSQLAAMLRAVLAEGEIGQSEAETLGGMPAGDLFALANAISALIDAPVTIEDRHSRVLAFSGRQDEADDSRLETILGRQVPERYRRLLEQKGVFRDLSQQDGPVYVEPVDGDIRIDVQRVALAVRAGQEFLGSIWAAVPERLSGEREQGFRDAAKLVALHMLRLRAGADVERRLRTELVGTALEGGAMAAHAIDRLGLTGQQLLVLVLGMSGRVRPATSVSGSAQAATERQWLADAFAMHLAATNQRAATAPIGDVCYAILPVLGRRAAPEDQARQVAAAFLERTGERIDATIGVGTAVRDVAGLVTSRADADRALRVLRAGPGPRRVATVSDVQTEALVLDLRDLAAARGESPTGAVARLYEYDQAHHTFLLGTLNAWLAAFGDVIAAAAAVHVHPNTFRYRLRRLAAVGQIDLADADQRFGAMLQLKVMGFADDADPDDVEEVGAARA